jgi:hypothetical protein
MFSVLVKWETFTKHISSQWMPSAFFEGEVIAAVQPLAAGVPREASEERNPQSV